MKQDPDNRPMLAQRMLQEMLQGMTTAAIVRASGINTVTIGNIAKGKALRVTDRVYASIGDAYEQFKSGGAPPAPAAGRTRGAKPKTAASAKSAAGPADASAGYFDAATLQAEIDRLEKRVTVLKQMISLASQL